jgi:uncharacterized protein YndB with AHSA1/START domain
MPKNLVAKASLGIAAPVAKVWDALVNPQLEALKKMLEK